MEKAQNINDLKNKFEEKIKNYKIKVNTCQKDLKLKNDEISNMSEKIDHLNNDLDNKCKEISKMHKTISDNEYK